MSEATLIFPNMRGGCVTVGNTVHTLFRVNGRRPGVATLAKVSAGKELEIAGGSEKITLIELDK